MSALSFATCAALPVTPEPARGALAGLRRSLAVHKAARAELPAFGAVELAPPPAPARLALPLRVAAWNLERCLFPEESAAALGGLDVVLLSEMDHGMARTGQRHPTADIAAALGMGYGYALEFLELGLGSEIERGFATEAENARGFHGNALLSRAALARPFRLTLPGLGQWFFDPEQPRLGERVAVGAEIETEAGPVVFVSTHLESACGQGHRAAQIGALIEALEAEFPGRPVLIGGDLNTGNHAGGDWRGESLFEIARAAGFSAHGGPEEAPTTRPSLITRWPERAMTLDWFLAKGLVPGPVAIRPALDATGRPLSDHDRIETEILGLAPAQAA